VCRSIPRFVVDLEELPVARAARESRQIADIFRVALRVRTNGTIACEGGAHLQIKLIGGTAMVWFAQRLVPPTPPGNPARARAMIDFPAFLSCRGPFSGRDGQSPPRLRAVRTPYP